MGIMLLKHRSSESACWLRISVYSLFISFALFAGHKLIAFYTPLQGLPSIATRVRDIEKEVDPEDFCFAILGDNKNDHKVFPEIMSKINDDPDISFVIHLGDMVKQPNKIFYQEFLGMVRAFLQKPFLSIPGNHDIDGQGNSIFYEQAFDKTHYTASIGGACLVFTDTEQLVSEKEQNWLRRALWRNRKSKPLIVFMHIPLYDPRGHDNHHALRKKIADQLLSIFDEYGVDHVYAGHIHGYWTGQWRTIPYTISGGAGAELYSHKISHGFYHYLKVRIQNGHIYEKVKSVSSTPFSRALNTIKANVKVEFLGTGLIAAIFGSSLISVCLWIRQWIQRKGRQNIFFPVPL